MKNTLLFILLLLVSSNISAFSNLKTKIKLNAKYNFGVVVNSNDYQIYRSKRLGREGVENVFLGLDKLNLPKPKTIEFI